MQPLTTARIQVLAGAVLLSTGGAAIKLCQMSAWQVASFRSLAGALAVLLLARPAWRALDGRAWLVGAALASSMIVFTLANKLTTAANAIFLQSAAPLYVLLLAPPLLGERFVRRDLGVMAVIAVGLLLLVAGEQAASASAPDPVRGNLVAAIGGLAWALTLLGFRWVGRDGGDRGAMLLAGNLIAGALCLPLALPLLQASAADWAVIAWLGIFQIAVAYLLVSAGLRHLTAFEGVLLMLLEPVLNPVWAALIQGEAPGLLPLAGGAVILAATTWRSLRAP